MSIEEILQNALEEKKKDNINLNKVVWVAAGGSNGGFYPAQYFMDRESLSVRSQMFSSNEFVYAPPKFCGADTLAVICSMRGTPETVEAAKVAKKLGATTIGLYVEESELTEVCDYNIQYQSIAIDSSKTEKVNSSVGLRIAITLLHMIEDYAGYTDAMEAFEIVDDIYRDAVEYTTPLAKEWAERNKKEDSIHVMGSGPAMGSAYIFSICNLMEMQ